MTWYLTVLSADGQLWEAEAWETKLKMSRGTLLPLAALAPAVVGGGRFPGEEITAAVVSAPAFRRAEMHGRPPQLQSIHDRALAQALHNRS